MTGAPARILVIDDEPIVCRSCARVLEAEGCTVETAFSPGEGLARVARGRFDVVLTDLMMSAMGGLEVVRRVRVLSPGTRVIVITGYATLATAAEAALAGAFNYVLKPFTPGELQEVVRRALEGARGSGRSAAPDGGAPLP